MYELNRKEGMKITINYTRTNSGLVNIRLAPRLFNDLQPPGVLPLGAAGAQSRLEKDAAAEIAQLFKLQPAPNRGSPAFASELPGVPQQARLSSGATRSTQFCGSSTFQAETGGTKVFTLRQNIAATEMRLAAAKSTELRSSLQRADREHVRGWKTRY